MFVLVLFCHVYRTQPLMCAVMLAPHDTSGGVPNSVIKQLTHSLSTLPNTFFNTELTI